MRHKNQYAHALLLLLAAPAGAVECLAVEGSAVRVSALAGFVDDAGMPPVDRILTSAPDPGTRRWITATDLRQWGLSPRWDLGTSGICLERRLKPLHPEDLRSRIQDALHSAQGEVRLLGITSIQPALFPEGELILPPAGFQPLSANEGVCSFLWRGSVEYDTHRRTPIKVLGRYQAETIRFVAKRDLRAGDALGPNDYERTAEPGCPHGAVGPAPPEGSIMRQALSQGAAIEVAMLKASQVVDEGSVVRVMASAGGASVSIEAIAERPGRHGEIVLVRNRENGKRIRVLLTGKGEASAIVAGAGAAR